MHSDRAFVLCHYRYDPLDRLVATSPSGRSPQQRFYCKTRLATQIQGLLWHTMVQHDDQLLAQQQRNGEHVAATLLATDRQRSVLHALSSDTHHPIAYAPYGHHPAESGLLSLLGFNGERRDPVTGHYLLGNGYRAFNPVLMRFNSPDSWSPFGEGGFNTYSYCSWGVSVFLCSGWLGPAVRQAVVLPARSGKSVSVQDRKLIHRHFPVVCRMTPVGGDVAQPKPYQFCRGLIGREVSSSFDDLA